MPNKTVKMFCMCIIVIMSFFFFFSFLSKGGLVWNAPAQTLVW